MAGMNDPITTGIAIGIIYFGVFLSMMLLGLKLHGHGPKAVWALFKEVHYREVLREVPWFRLLWWPILMGTIMALNLLPPPIGLGMSPWEFFLMGGGDPF